MAAYIIKNFQQLAISPLRKQALLIAEAGYEAINTTKAVDASIKFNRKKNTFAVNGQKFNLKDFDRIFFLGFGKAAWETAAAIGDVIGDKLTGGYALDVAENLEEAKNTRKKIGKIIGLKGTHPFVSEINICHTKEMAGLVEEPGRRDLVICAVSGGGSALFCLPFEISATQEAEIFKSLTLKGAAIQELNTVRKHTSLVKGGRLAKLLYPATVIGLIFSDVPGNDLSAVASGPTVKDGTTAREAGEILRKYEVLESAGLPSCPLAETPKEEKYFARVHNFLLVSAEAALEAMREKAEDLGFKARIFSPAFQGLARELGPSVVKQNIKLECLLGAGESTVKITGSGCGGRNQEMALAALPVIGENQVFACLASDGHDNTEVAGAIVDRLSLRQAEVLKLNAAGFLDDNDSFEFFQLIGSFVFTGPTGSNVADFFVCLKSN
ncbi:MAG: DUF4147 domain-containing protein [Patescibacteria group bacterium]|nr:DUF4147 domain-containing protein [Patescibacteria group bacterium]